MERYMGIFTKLAFVLLAVWVVMAGLGITIMPGTVKQAVQQPRRRGRGLMWNQFGTPSPDDLLPSQYGQVM